MSQHLNKKKDEHSDDDDANFMADSNRNIEDSSRGNAEQTALIPDTVLPPIGKMHASTEREFDLTGQKDTMLQNGAAYETISPGQLRISEEIPIERAQISNDLRVEQVAEQSHDEDSTDEEPFEHRTEHTAEKQKELSDHINKTMRNNWGPKLQEELNTPYKYMDDMMHSIPIDRLYTIVDTLYQNEQQIFCPVILKINKNLLNLENDLPYNDEPDMSKIHIKYLLQVWRTDGIMIYERRLHKRLAGWSMSENIFLFQEDSKEDKNHEIYCLTNDKTHSDRIRLHKFILPDKVKEIQDAGDLAELNSHSIDPSDRIAVEKRKHMIRQQSSFQLQTKSVRVKNNKKMADIGEIQDAKYNNQRPNNVAPEDVKMAFAEQNAVVPDQEFDEDDHKQDMENLKQAQHEDKTLSRPQVKRNICLCDGSILIAEKYQIIELSLKKLGHDFGKVDEGEGIFMEQTTITDDHFNIIDLNKSSNYRFVQFIDIGNSKSAMVLENEETRQVRFMLPNYRRDGENSFLEFEMLGLIQSKPGETGDLAKIFKCETVISSNQDSDHKLYIVCLILRKDGTVEVYSDHEYAHSFGSSPDHFCVDIEKGEYYFYLKYLNLKHSKDDTNSPPKFEMRKVAHQMRNRIKYNATEKITNPHTKWESLPHNAIARYMKLYDHYIHYQCFVLVAHRGYISVFDLSSTRHENLTENGAWINHIKVSNKDRIRSMFLERRKTTHSRNEKAIHKNLPYHAEKIDDLFNYYLVGAVCGPNTIKSFKMHRNGSLKEHKFKVPKDEKIIEAETEEWRAPGVIMKICSDTKYKLGTFLYMVADRNEPIDKIKGKRGRIEKGQNMIGDTFKRTHFYDQKVMKDGEVLPEDKHQNHSFYNSVVEIADKKPHDLKVLHQAYGEIRELGHFMKNSQSPEERAKEKSYRNLNSLTSIAEEDDTKSNYKENTTLKVEADFQIQLVITNCSFWTDGCKDEDEWDKLHEEIPALLEKPDIQTAESNVITAMVIYSKNGGLQIVPFCKTTKGEKKTRVSKQQSIQSNLSNKSETGLGESAVKQPYKLYMKHAKTLLDEDHCKEYLKDEHLVFLRFVTPRLATEKMEINSCVIVTDKGMHVFNPSFEHELVHISGMHIQQASLQDTNYLYIMKNRCVCIYESHANPEHLEEMSAKSEVSHYEKSSGIVAVNLKLLFDGQYREIPMTPCIQGTNHDIDRGWTTDNICILKNFNEIVMMPLPHYNLLSFVGMGARNEYLASTASTNGFFTALNKWGQIFTWSTVTGNLLFIEEQRKEDDCHQSKLHGYEVYRSDPEDNFYTNPDMQQGQHLDYKISLLVSRLPVDIEKNTHVPEIKDEINRQLKDLHNYDEEAEDLPDEMFTMQGKNQLGQSQIKMEKTLRQEDLFHFKVISISQPKSLYQDECKGKTRSKLQFHFFHKILQPFKKKDNTETFDWYLKRGEISHRIYMRKSRKMLEVIQDRLAFLWNDDRGNGDEKFIEGSLVKYKKPIMMPNFPFLACKLSSSPYFMDPQYDKMLDFDYENKCMRLIECKGGKVLANLPKEAIYIPQNVEESELTKAVFCNVQFIDNNKFQTYNFKTGFRTRYNVVYKDKENENDELEEQKYELSSYSAVMESANEFENEEGDYQQYFLVQNKYSKSMTLQRVQYRHKMYMRAIQDVKTYTGYAYYPKYMNNIFPIDYEQKFKSPFSQFQVDRTFSWMDWKLAELVTTIADFSFESMPAFNKMRLSYNIFPLGNSLLKMLASTTDSNNDGKVDTNEKLSGEQSVHDCLAIFEASKTGFLHQISKGIWKEINYQVPLIVDCYGLTPLDYSLGQSKHIDQSVCLRALNTYVADQRDAAKQGDKMLRKNQKKIARQPDNRKQADCEVLLDGVKEPNETFKDRIRKFKPLPDSQMMTPNIQIARAILSETKQRKNLFAGSLFVVDSLIKAIGEFQLEEAIDYLNGAFFPTNHIPGSSNTEIKGDYQQETDSIGDYGLIQLEGLLNSEELQEKMFEEKSNEKNSQKLYEYNFYDIPLIFFLTPQGCEFMQALQAYEDTAIFATDAVQMLITNHWKFWSPWNTYLIILPRIIHLIVFTIWSSFLMPTKEVSDGVAHTILEVIILFIAAYFLYIELRSIQHKWKHETKLYLVTVISPFMLLSCICYEWYLGDEPLDEIFWELKAWAAFFIWFSFLILLRSVEFISPVINMVSHSILSAMPYLLVLFIGVNAFADAFQSIAQIVYVKTASLEDEAEILEPPFDKTKEIGGFWDWKDVYMGEYIFHWKNSFITGIGGFDPGQTTYYTDSQWLLFFTCILFNVVVLANLFLAVVGQIFGEVYETQVERTYQELVNQICLLQRTFPRAVKSDMNARTLLFMAKERQNITYKFQQDKKVRKDLSELKGIVQDIQENVDEKMSSLQLLIQAQQSSQQRLFQHNNKLQQLMSVEGPLVAQLDAIMKAQKIPFDRSQFEIKTSVKRR